MFKCFGYGFTDNIVLDKQNFKWLSIYVCLFARLYNQGCMLISYSSFPVGWIDHSAFM